MRSRPRANISSTFKWKNEITKLKHLPGHLVLLLTRGGMHVLFHPRQRLVHLQHYRLVLRSRGTPEELDRHHIPEYLNYMILVHWEGGLQVVSLQMCFISLLQFLVLHMLWPKRPSSYPRAIIMFYPYRTTFPLLAIPSVPPGSPVGTTDGNKLVQLKPSLGTWFFSFPAVSLLGSFLAPSLYRPFSSNTQYSDGS